MWGGGDRKELGGKRLRTLMAIVKPRLSIYWFGYWLPIRRVGL